MIHVFIKPKFLLKEFSNSNSIWYGLVPFLFYILLAEITWLTAYFGWYYQPISPMPKLIPISDVEYPLFMAIIGSFIKLIGIFIFTVIYEKLTEILKKLMNFAKI